MAILFTLMFGCNVKGKSGFSVNILTSANGITSTKSTKSSSGVNEFIRNVNCDGLKFVAAGMDTIMTSPDGTL
jgi:hypothetical protein